MGHRVLMGLVVAAGIAACGGSSRGTEGEGGGAQGGSGVTGGTGGSAMPAGSAGSGGSGGSGSGSGGGAGMYRGTRGQPNPPVCTDSDGLELYPEQVLGTTVGLTETVTDYCDDDGNLVQHHCEWLPLPTTDCAPCVPGCAYCDGECPPCGVQTGGVLESPFDCGGDCHDGVCLSWCPTQGHELRIEIGADSILRVENETVPGVYACTPIDDGSAEGICQNLDGYVGERVYGYTGTCYGQAPASLRLVWMLDNEGPYECFVECTRTAARSLE